MHMADADANAHLADMQSHLHSDTHPGPTEQAPFYTASLVHPYAESLAERFH